MFAVGFALLRTRERRTLLQTDNFPIFYKKWTPTSKYFVPSRRRAFCWGLSFFWKKKRWRTCQHHAAKSTLIHATKKIISYLCRHLWKNCHKYHAQFHYHSRYYDARSPCTNIEFLLQVRTCCKDFQQRYCKLKKSST